MPCCPDALTTSKAKDAQGWPAGLCQRHDALIIGCGVAEVETAQSAVKWYDGATYKSIQGTKLHVSIASRPDGAQFGKGKGKGGKGG